MIAWRFKWQSKKMLYKIKDGSSYLLGQAIPFNCTSPTKYIIS
jgi:hypothetical protein